MSNPAIDPEDVAHELMGTMVARAMRKEVGWTCRSARDIKSDIELPWMQDIRLCTTGEHKDCVKRGACYKGEDLETCRRLVFKEVRRVTEV